VRRDHACSGADTRLRYTDAPPNDAIGVPAEGTLGLSVAGDRGSGENPERPADRAGVAVGMRLLAVNGRRFTPDRLRDALADRVARRAVEFLVEDGDGVRTVRVPYADGLRFLGLVRDEARPDVLGAILGPRAG
jgi:predicted metalloprotease with PDZ domain